MRWLVLLALLGCAKHFEAQVQASQKTQAIGDVASDSQGKSRSVREGGALDLKDYYPDGKLRRELHRAPVKTTRDAEKQETVQAALQEDAMNLFAGRSEGDSKPEIPSLFGMILGHWGWGLLALAGLLVGALLVFRKSGLVQRLSRLLPFPFSLLALALPAKE